MGAHGQPEGAMVGENEVAQKVYESLQRGEMPVFATKPNGVPPVGGHNSLTVADIPAPGSVTPVPFAGSVMPGSRVLFGGLREEIALLREDIRNLMEVLKSL